MIIYNPHDVPLLKERLKICEDILKKIPQKHAFITGSFLFKEKYRDIDVFIVSRSRKKQPETDRRLNITYIDFNELYSLFYHSISKFCVSKGILPKPRLRATLSDFWAAVNEAVPELMNRPARFRKIARQLVLNLEFFRSGSVLDSYELRNKLDLIPSASALLEELKRELPGIISKSSKRSYTRRFFYTQAGYHKDTSGYKSQRFLYELARDVARGSA